MSKFDEIHESMIIGGRLVDSKDRLEVRNPARPSELVGTIVRGKNEHVDAAVQEARAAQRDWATKGFRGRAEILQRALAMIENDYDDRAALLVRENGKPLEQARNELIGASRRQRLALSYAEQLEVGQQIGAPRGRSFVSYSPYGVVASIVPWNSPVVLGFTQIIAALLGGNTVVIKPPETCPLTLIRSVKHFSSALPPGVLNVLTGLPAEIGDALTSHPEVDKVAFTGSIQSARHILKKTSDTIKGVTLELGGNDPAIIMPDAALSPELVNSIRDAAFEMAGQVCMAIKRIYVPASLQDEFISKFLKSVDELVIGDGLLDQVTMGPLHSKGARDRAFGLLESVQRTEDAVLHPLGRIDPDADFTGGYFMRPIIVTDIRDESPLVSDEQFCPVIPVLIYDSFEEVVARANNTVFGLSGSVWGSDVEQAITLASRIEAGQIWINAHGPAALNHRAPYGGVKQSGIGRKSGLEGILEFIQTQTITTCEW